MEAEEPDLVLDAIEGRVPFDRLAHAGDGARDERVEAAPDVAFPARHGGDVGLHRGIAVALRDLRVAAREKTGFAATRLAAAFFATFADFLDVVLAIAFTQTDSRQTSIGPRQDLLQLREELLPPRLGAAEGLLLIRPEANLLHAQVRA